MLTSGEGRGTAATAAAATAAASAPAKRATAPDLSSLVLVLLDTVRQNVGRAYLEAGVTPLVVDVGHDIGDVFVGQFPCRHDAVERYAVDGQLAFEPAGDGLDGTDLVGVEVVRFRQRRERICDALAIGLMAGLAIIGEDGFPGLDALGLVLAAGGAFDGCSATR